MSSIQNAGRKGFCLMYFFIFLILFIALWAFIYYYNGRFLGN